MNHLHGKLSFCCPIGPAPQVIEDQVQQHHIDNNGPVVQPAVIQPQVSPQPNPTISPHDNPKPASAVDAFMDIVPHNTNDTSGIVQVDMEDDPNGQISLALQQDQMVGSLGVAGISSRGAVIALGLGLSVTALLLLFVGCRLRTVKTRLRRGRPLTTGEADYLINGMYL